MNSVTASCQPAPNVIHDDIVPMISALGAMGVKVAGPLPGGAGQENGPLLLSHTQHFSFDVASK